ncbi:MAG: hypothetical protein HYX96_07425 [Chloroflexi bacterium]|nr:hypothetical protein [Chloroflexota bacterium]
MGDLLYVPVIHAAPDMGSLARGLEGKAVTLLGGETWARHRATVAGLWQSIARFFDSVNASGLVVFQDGLVAGGDAGQRVVREGAAAGSPNFLVIQGLVARGAVIAATEAAAPVRQEMDYLRNISDSRTPGEREAAALRYRRALVRLTRERDAYIAGRVAGELSHGGRGVLFIGAYHDVISRLPPGISVREVKKLAMVRGYLNLLVQPGRQPGLFRELAEYLTAPVQVAG